MNIAFCSERVIIPFLRILYKSGISITQLPLVMSLIIEI